MVLEATILVLDNSEWMRNGDYIPSRLDAQKDAVNLLFSAKTQSNPENTVGVMTMAGKGPEVLVTLTNDLGKILGATHNISPLGQTQFSRGVQVAQLALKHRQNKTQRQRIIVFVGSPIEEDEAMLVKLGKKLKKNNVAMDIVNFGEEDANTAKLQALIEAINSNENSHMVTVPAGPVMLSDSLVSSAIVQGESGAPPGIAAAAGGGGGFEFGFDPNLDPELAMALRISMEEERARQQAAGGEGNAADSSAATKPVDPMNIVEANTEEDAELAQALALSLAGGDTTMTDETTSSSTNNNALGNLPGVDPNDPKVKDAMKRAGGKKEDEKK